MKNQKGITLIALVVTIVVLLILAGTTIAMLSGENGIITRAQNAQIANTEGEVLEKINMAYTTINTIVLSKTSVDQEYSPLDSDTGKELAQTVVDELGMGATLPEASGEPSVSEISAKGYTVTYNPTNHTIAIKYTDNNFTEATGDKYDAITETFTLNATNVTRSNTADRQVQY